jgi:hypothetical protein
MLDDKYPYQKKGIYNAQSKCQPVAVIQRIIHGYPNCQKRTEGIYNLNGGFFLIGNGILIERSD